MAEQRQRVITPRARLSYPSLFKARANPERPDAAPRFSAVLLFDGDADIKDLKKIAIAALRDKFGPDAKFGGEDGYRNPFRKGNSKTTEITVDGATKEIVSPGYEDKIFISVGTTLTPGVVDESAQPVLDQEVVYAGCFVRAQVHAYAYKVKGNKGVAFGLDNIQKIGDGDKFSNRPDAAKVFSPVAGAETSSNDVSDDDDFLDDDAF